MLPNERIKLIDYTFDSKLNDNTIKRELVENRMIFSKIVYDMHKLSLMRIGSYINKNHATIIHYLKQHENLMDFDVFYKTKYKKILALVNNYQANNIKQLNTCEFKIQRYETSTNKI